MMKATHLLPALCLLLALAPSSVAGDEFYLTGEGYLEGELVNRDRGQNDPYIVSVDSGQVVLPAAQVRGVRLLTDEQREYLQLAADLPDTVEDHWRMAQWCQEHRLAAEMQYHREQVIRLEPEHADARAALGYERVHGEWLLPAERQARRGLVRHGGEWMVPQAAAMDQREHERVVARGAWNNQVSDWRRDLNREHTDRRFQAALDGFRTVDDPYAAPALASILEDESEPRDVKLLVVASLGRTHCGTAVSALINAAIKDADAEVRFACLDELERYGRATAVGAFLKALRSSDNREINRGAHGLSRLDDPENPRSVDELIDALVTSHKVQVPRQGGGGGAQLGGVFSPNGGGGLSVGGSPQVVERDVQNTEVLAALITLTGGPSALQYDKDRWRSWYVDQQTPHGLDLRRGE